MDFENLSGEGLIAELKTAGRSPYPQLLQAVIDNKESHPLIVKRFKEACIDGNLNELSVDDPGRTEGVLLGRLAIQLGLKGVLPVLGELLRTTWEDDVTIDGLGRDVAHFGPDAIPILQALIELNTLNKWHNGKSTAITILTDIALLHPSVAAQVKDVLRSGLPPRNKNGGISVPKDEMWSEISIALGKLQDGVSHQTILAMIRQGVTDSAVLSRDRYEQFLNGEKTPRQPESFDIFKKYAALQDFESMLAGLGDAPEPIAPDQSQDLVSRAKRIEAQEKAAKKKRKRK